MQSPGPNASKQGSVFEGVTPYHWLVVIVAACGWVFDVVDMRIFTLAREPALKEVLGGGAADAVVKSWCGWATAVMMIGWATGGIIFGTMSDRWGRVKTMVLTLLAYSGFTGLCGLARTADEFVIYRFLVGLGMGGMFGAATTLVAESVPGNFRSLALGVLQSLSACGNIIGSLLSTQIKPGQADFLFGYSGWRIIFFVGVLPALLVIPILTFLREPGVEGSQGEIQRCQRGAKAYRLDSGSVPSPALAQEPAGRGRPGPGGYGRTLGHRLLLAGADFHGPEGRVADRHRHGARLRDRLAGRGIPPGDDDVHPGGHVCRSATGLCRLVPTLPDHDHFRLQQSEVWDRRLLDVADDGLRPVVGLRRVLDLLSRALSDAPSGHWSGLLLQYRALSRRRISAPADGAQPTAHTA